MKRIVTTILAALIALQSFGQKDPDFHIYICFGQSNMEGMARPEAVDKVPCERFQVLQAVDCGDYKMGEWRTATAPLSRCSTGLGPVDWFGRTMVENLPENIKIGVIVVSVAGCSIAMFDKDTSESYGNGKDAWTSNVVRQYGGNVYRRLVELSLKAEEDGMIKGILFHQGESDLNDPEWSARVKKVYDDLLSDIGLEAGSIPLLAGETLYGGRFDAHNEKVRHLPDVLPQASVVSADGCNGADDRTHFTAEGYRELGKRYARVMLSLPGQAD